MGKIHPTAIIDPSAEIHATAEIGPFCVIEAGVVVGEGTVIESCVRLYSGTVIGRNNKIAHNAVLGGLPQDISFDTARKTGLHIGDDNVIREGCNFHRSTKEENPTRIGNNCMIMSNNHIAHDCQVGNDVIIVSTTCLAGHVIVDDKAFISGLVGVHQFCRIGSYTMVGGVSKVVKDIPPYAMSDGSPATIVGINVIGLKRAGMKPEVRDLVKKAYKILYNSGLNTTQALAQLNAQDNPPEVKGLIKFVEDSPRGVSDHR